MPELYNAPKTSGIFYNESIGKVAEPTPNISGTGIGTKIQQKETAEGATKKDTSAPSDVKTMQSSK